MSISFKDILRRLKINGIDLPLIGGGLSWEIEPSEKEIAQKLLIFLADKRALYYDWGSEIPPFVIESILNIRERLTHDLQELNQSSQLALSIREMQLVCHEYLTFSQGQYRSGKHHDYYRSWPYKFREEDKEFFIRLGKLRHSFGIQISSIAIAYNIDVDERLEPILPGGEIFKD